MIHGGPCASKPHGGPEIDVAEARWDAPRRGTSTWSPRRNLFLTNGFYRLGGVRLSDEKLHYLLTKEYTHGIMRNSWSHLSPVREWFGRASACLLSLLIALPAVGQSPPQSSPSQVTQSQQTQAPTVRVTTRLVQVNVIAQRADGKPVADLTKDDFALFDKGQPQPISTFSRETIHVVTAAENPGAAVAAAHVYSNRLEQKAGVPSAVTVILLDQLNTRFADQSYARAQVIKFLSQLQPGDRVALYTLTDRITVLHDFTKDATSLLAAINRHRTTDSAQVEASEPEQVDSSDAQMDAFLNAANQRMATFFQVNRAKTTAEAFEAIANHLMRIPGRKNLVWVSGSFPFTINEDSLTDMQNFSYEIEKATRALNNANLAVYPVDARGLIPPQFRQGSVSSRSLARGTAPALITMSPNPQHFATMNTLADRTGGRAFYNTNDIFGSIRKAIEDSQVTYVLGYYPSHGDWDGKWREIKVEVKRAGVHLRFRRGYFALPDSTPTPQQEQAMLRDAVTSSLDFTTLGINITADAVDVPGARRLHATIQVDARDITLEPQGGRWVGVLDFVFVQRAADGKQLASESQQISMHLTKERYDLLMKNGLIWERDLPIVAGVAQLRLVARDNGSGSVGSVSVPVDKLFSAQTH